jgi:K+-transporting ATPase ATPase B chain
MPYQAALTMFDPNLVKPAIRQSFIKLAPQTQWRNPVMLWSISAAY